MDRILGSLVDRVVDLHDCRLVTTSVTVIWRRKYRNDGSVVLPLVAFHHQLMSSSNKVQAVNVGKLFGNVLPERVSGSPW
jgi:hypothetical protein